MAGDQEIQQLELFCRDLYETTVPTARTEAEKILINFQNSADAMAKCRALLERGSSIYAQLLATSTLTKLVSRPTQIIALQERVQIKNYILNYLLTRDKLDPRVVRTLAQLYCRILKNSWFEKENDQFVLREVVADAQPFLQGSLEQCAIGVQLLSALTNEMSQFQDACTNTYLAKMRKTVASFRNETLIDIMNLCRTSMTMALEKHGGLNLENPAQIVLISELIELAENCFTSPLPSSCVPEVLDSSVFQPFIDLYFRVPAPLSSKALSCVTEAMVLGKYCNTGQKQEFVNRLFNQILRILQTLHGLNDARNYHEFCRMIDALKTHYFLNQFVLVDCYEEFIRLLTKVTVDSLTQMLLIAPNSVYFLLQFWQNLSSSFTYYKIAEGKAHGLEKIVPQISNTYISSRLESVAVVMRDKLENPLEDETIISHEMDQFSVIGRCDFPATFELLAPLFDATVLAYQELWQREAVSAAELNLLEGKLSWLIHMIGSTLKGRLSYYFDAAHDTVDGDLISRVIRLMQLTDERLAQKRAGCQHLETAFLAFFDKFRLACMGDNTRKASKVYERMKELVGVDSEASVFTLLIRKVVTNLKFWSSSELVLQLTVELLNELSVGNNGNLRKFVKMEEVQCMLTNHTGEHFPFLGLNKNPEDLRRRTKFYKALGRFVIIDSYDDKTVFTRFMAPFSTTLELLGQTLSNTETALCKSEETKWTIVGLARDLRGILQSFANRLTYIMFFEWIHPTYLPVLERAVELWCHDPDATTPLLKFFIELVQNRNDRLYFGPFSANCVILFREISKTLCVYGLRGTPANENVKPALETVRLKEITLCFQLLRIAFCSNFVHFGIMQFYGDESIDNALNCFVKLAFTVTIADLTQNPKLATAYFGVLRFVSEDHTKFLCTVDPNVVLYVLQTAAEGVLAKEEGICVDSASVIDHMTTFLYDQTVLIKEKKATNLLGNENLLRVLQAVEQHPEALQQALASLLNLALFEECRSHWAMSKPLLGLILLNEDHYGKLQVQLIGAQPAEKQAAIATLFGDLFKSVERNLSTRNKEIFSLNVINFRRSMAGLM